MYMYIHMYIKTVTGKELYILLAFTPYALHGSGETEGGGGLRGRFCNAATLGVERRATSVRATRPTYLPPSA